jgi:PAS domain S-box-containing protein
MALSVQSPPPADSLFQSAFENAAIGMALITPEGAWIHVNKSLCEITGYTEAELVRRAIQDITHPDDLDLSNIGKMLAGEIATYQIEKRFLHKNGAIVWVLLSVSLVRNAKGDPLFFITQIQDINARKEGEPQLSEAAARMEELRNGLLKICAWTKRIQIEGRWISVDEFLRDHLHLNLTHGMSVEGGRIFKGDQLQSHSMADEEP